MSSLSRVQRKKPTSLFLGLPLEAIRYPAPGILRKLENELFLSGGDFKLIHQVAYTINQNATAVIS